MGVYVAWMCSYGEGPEVTELGLLPEINNLTLQHSTYSMGGDRGDWGKKLNQSAC